MFPISGQLYSPRRGAVACVPVVHAPDNSEFPMTIRERISDNSE